MEIINIIENNIPEGQKLEFKQYVFEDGKFNRLVEKSKNNLVKEIIAFANSVGGTIIIGISEDEKHNPNDVIDIGVDNATFETWQQSFRQFISAKIKPVIHGIDLKLHNYEGKSLISISIPKSIMKPHAFDDGNKDSFFIRYGNTINSMRLEELRSAFHERDIIQSRVLNFKNERISKILSGEVMGPLEDDSLLVLHIIPDWSMGLNSYVNLKEFKEDYKIDVFSPSRDLNSKIRRGWSNFNYDGLRIFYGDQTGAIDSYTQVFYNGSLECVERRMMNAPTSHGNDETKIYRWDRMEVLLVEKIRDFIESLSDHELPKPYNIFLTLLNLNNKTAVGNSFGDSTPSGPITQTVIKIVPAYINEEVSLGEALFPLLTNLAHTFGYDYTSLYSNDGIPNPNVF